MSVHTKEPKKEPRPHTKLPEAPHKEQRRAHPMNSGKRVKAEAHTRVVNPYGCMVVLEHDLPLEHRVALTNVPMSASNAAVIVWKSDERPEGGWEYGVELVAPAMDFWGLEL